MENFQTEEQQVEAIKGFWKDNGTSIIAGLVIGLSGFVGFTLYQESKLSDELAKSDAYMTLQDVAQEQPAEFITKAEQYIKENGDSSYASLTSLALAKETANAKDWSATEQHLQNAIAKSQDEGMKAIATIRLARVQLQTEQTDKALTTLSKPMPKAFTATVEETKGDAYFMQDKKDLARNAYQAALDESGAAASPSLQMKIDDLAEVIILTK